MGNPPTNDCPSWCTGKHNVLTAITIHRGEDVRVPMPGAAPGSLIEVVTVTPSQMTVNPGASPYLEADGPRVELCGWGSARLVIDLAEADRVAELQSQLDNTAVADAIRTVAATMNGGAGR